MSKTVYEYVKEFTTKYPGGVTWHRLKKHSNVIQNYLNPGEEVIYAFAGQKNEKFYDVFQTAVVALTNKRILVGQKRIVFGYFLYSITPDLFNDLNVYCGLLWGKVTIDTIKEEIVISNLPKKGLDEIETNITEFMMAEKQKYNQEDK